MCSTDPRLDPASGQVLLRLARRAIEEGSRTGIPLEVDPSEFPRPLREPAGSFVTLHRGGELRGCVGNLEPDRPLVCDVAHSAFRAAFRDPRFSAVKEVEVGALEIHVSVLGPLQRLEIRTEEELATVLRPQSDGLLLRDGACEATFLPAVWESLPDPHAFVRELKRKAGIPDDHWSRDTLAYRYAVQSFRE